MGSYFSQNADRSPKGVAITTLIAFSISALVVGIIFALWALLDGSDSEVLLQDDTFTFFTPSPTTLIPIYITPTPTPTPTDIIETPVIETPVIETSDTGTTRIYFNSITSDHTILYNKTFINVPVFSPNLSLSNGRFRTDPVFLNIQDTTTSSADVQFQYDNIFSNYANQEVFATANPGTDCACVMDELNQVCVAVWSSPTSPTKLQMSISTDLGCTSWGTPVEIYTAANNITEVVILYFPYNYSNDDMTGTLMVVMGTEGGCTLIKSGDHGVAWDFMINTIGGNINQVICVPTSDRAFALLAGNTVFTYSLYRSSVSVFSVSSASGFTPDSGSFQGKGGGMCFIPPTQRISIALILSSTGDVQTFSIEGSNFTNNGPTTRFSDAVRVSCIYEPKAGLNIGYPMIIVSRSNSVLDSLIASDELGAVWPAGNIQIAAAGSGAPSGAIVIDEDIWLAHITTTPTSAITKRLSDIWGSPTIISSFQGGFLTINQNVDGVLLTHLNTSSNVVVNMFPVSLPVNWTAIPAV